ncbi:unnamed protein product, partial [Sphenostylis stenocarpa]
LDITTLQENHELTTLRSLKAAVRVNFLAKRKQVDALPLLLHRSLLATYLVCTARRSIFSTLTPHILHACWGHLASTVAFNLEPFISA